MSTTRTGSTLTRIIRKVPLVTNGDALVGLTFVVSGVLIGRSGVLKLWASWGELSQYLPISLPENLPKIILGSFPLIFKVFTCTVSSICAVLIGALWVFSGLAEAVQSRKEQSNAASLDQPGLVAESLRTSLPRHWQSMPWPARMLGSVWPAGRFMSPVSYEMVRAFAWAFRRILLAAVAIAVIAYGLHSIPFLVRKVLQREITLVVPSMMTLYHLLGFVVVVDLLAALSLVPLRRKLFARSELGLQVKGRGDPHALFALVEEGYRLLTPKGRQHRSPIRLKQRNNDLVKGTVMESPPLAGRSLGRPAAYLCLPLIVIMLQGGFSRLIHFDGPVKSMNYADFLSFHLPANMLAVAFGFGMILCGLHFAQWARRIFGIRRFRSSVLFCRVTVPESSQQASRPGETRKGRPVSGEAGWTVSEGVDDHFAAWARQPDLMGRFRMDAYWGEVISEAAAAESPRHLIEIRQSPTLDEATRRILGLPFNVALTVEIAETLKDGG